MPRRDGMGPMGDGPMTGRRLGPCFDSKAAKCGAGLGLGLGVGLALRYGLVRRLGRRLGIGAGEPTTEEQALLEEQMLLKERLDEIERRLEEL